MDEPTMKAATVHRTFFPKFWVVQSFRWAVTRWLARPIRRRVERQYRAAVVKLDRLGDGVLAVGAVRTLLKHYGESDCLLVIASPAEALMAAEFPHTPRVVLPVTVGYRQLYAEGSAAREILSRIACEVVICLRHQREDWDELVLAWIGGTKTHLLEGGQLGISFRGRRMFSLAAAEHTAFVSMPISEDGFCRELDRHRHLVSHVLKRGVAPVELLPRFERLGRGVAQPSIVVSPFARRAIRDFPEPLLLTALRAVRARSAVPIRLHGDAVQRARLMRLLEVIQADGVNDVTCAAPMNLNAFAETIAVAKLVLTVETATAHLATAFDRPAVILIGGGHFGEFSPWRRSARQVWLTERLNCFGCDWRCVQTEPYCLTRITASAVERTVAHLYALEERARVTSSWLDRFSNGRTDLPRQ
jgi:ADP-heptose:LPS heptosyltransferase